LLFFEGWSVVESGVNAKLFFGRLIAAQVLRRQESYCGGINSSIPHRSQGI